MATKNRNIELTQLTGWEDGRVTWVGDFLATAIRNGPTIPRPSSGLAQRSGGL